MTNPFDSTISINVWDLVLINVDLRVGFWQRPPSSLRLQSSLNMLLFFLKEGVVAYSGGGLFFSSERSRTGW